MAINIAKMKKRLEEQRHELEENLKDSTAGPPAETNGDPATIDYQDKEDDATDTQEMQQEQGIRFTLQSQLDDVNAALKRIEDGTYGRCVDCGKEIPEKRLEAIPWAERCIEDEEKHDRLLASEDEVRGDEPTEGTHFY
ncbi:TraR/DksA family transcriptional regulator [Dictyobacter kobayashii]|uniref:Zinc finger DksA/TraR C4-type domain-containing protein n=1 Tax=Dictyobacter kobayashii TaxID=2014872 RepID=A0A402ARN9_9CHLR|nr:TraR/DksA C4-type zinc finger protein [Dictyobacter kobayashii]GCE21759.1 hypothetical protein KDK_55590 [Dictyobacter kobayashii]